MIVIMRGMSGSGKSTFAKSLVDYADSQGRVKSGHAESDQLISWLVQSAGKNKAWDAMVFSADDFFVWSGVYKWDPDKIPQAHADCLRRFIERVRMSDESMISIVDNTNTTVGEFVAYARVGAAYGHSVHFVQLQCLNTVAHERNIHGVPAATVTKQMNNISRSESYLTWYGKVHNINTGR